MDTESSLFLAHRNFSSPAPGSSVSAQERHHSQSSAFSTTSSSAPPTSPATACLPRPKKRKLRAPDTWKHSRVPQGDEETHQNNQRLWYCGQCHNPPWRTVSTTSAKRHTRNDHGIVIEDDERPAKKALQQSLEVAFSRAAGKSRAMLARDEQSALRNTIDLDAFYEAQIQLITRRRLPLNCVSWPEYQALLCAVNSRADEVLIQSGNTALAHIELSYTVHRANIKARLRVAKSQIHFSIDLWSSSHRKAFLGICGQCVDADYRPREALLGLPNVQHSHSGEAMAQHLVNTVRYFDIAGNVGYFTSDNATANDTCLRAVATALAIEFGVRVDSTERRVRCGGHIINLCLQAFLFASSKEALSAAIHKADYSAEVTVAESLQGQLRQKRKGQHRCSEENQAGWRSIGPLGKLHNIAVFIRSSTIHSDACSARQIWSRYKDHPVAKALAETSTAPMTAYERLAQSLDVTETHDYEDELEKFINGTPCKIEVSPLTWWAREEQRMEYPRLHKMAIDVLSIPPMSDKAERVFSGARRTVSFDRARLGADTIEMTECLGNWNKNDLIRTAHTLGEGDH